FNMMLEYQQAVVLSIKKAISDYKDYIVKFDEADSSSAASKSKTAAHHKHDGTIYTLTIETLNFIKKLFEYRQTIDALPREVIADENGSSSGGAAPSASSKHIDIDHSVFFSLTYLILTSLESNMDHKAKSYKLPSLSSIFLLNNFHYIAKCLRRQEISLPRIF